MQISTKDEFSALMAEVDESLKREGVPIHARQIQAWLRVCETLNLSLPLVGKAIPGIYEGESLSGHIHEWCEARYGDRLKVDPSPGCFPIEIRGDLYLARLPLILGRVALFIDRVPSPSGGGSGSIGPAFCNLLDFVVDLTDATRLSLTDSELDSVSRICVTALDQARALQKVGSVLRSIIDDDLRLSAKLAVDGKFGLSRWHSLQSSEKAMKTFIKHRGAQASRVHDLKKLHGEAVNVGLEPLDLTDLARAQCQADVRYDPSNSNQPDTLAANEAARRICAAIAVQFRQA